MIGLSLNHFLLHNLKHYARWPSDKSFHPSLLLFLFDWLTNVKVSNLQKRCWFLYCNNFYLLRHTTWQMYVNMIKIINEHNTIAMYWFNLQTTSHGYFMYRLVHVLELLFANTTTIKLNWLTSACDVNVRLLDCLFQITNYKIHNVLCLANKKIICT